MDGTTLKRYSGSSWTAVFPYSAGTQQLLLGDDARELYILYVCAQIDFYNGEYDRYNNESAAFNSAYQTFEKAYSRSRLQYRKFKNL